MTTTAKEIVRVGDIIKIDSCHFTEYHYFEVYDVREDCVISQPCDFHHWYHEIVAIYTYNGKDFICVWEKE